MAARTPQPWSLYWPDWLVKFTIGRTPRVLYGGWNQNTRGLMHVQPGDPVFLLSGYQGRLHLLGGLNVDRCGPSWDRSEAPHSGSSLQATGRPLAPFRIDRIVPPDWLRHWTFRNADGTDRGVRHLGPDGRLLKTTSFQGCYRLRPSTSERLMALLEGRAAACGDPVLHSLEQKRLAAADDAALAQIHADALLERGDPRGLVIRLELDDAHHGNRAARTALRTLVAEHAPHILARPGGYPFRTGWGWPKRCR